MHIIAAVKKRWGEILLFLILLVIIVSHVRPGFLILGNDTFAPELNPRLILERSLFSPGWRTYRGLGVASDSEQADIVRAVLYSGLASFLPPWVISQGYLFLAFFVGVWSMANLVAVVVGKNNGKDRQLSFLCGGILYLASMITAWVFFYPLHLFVAAYAFLPLVLWRLGLFIRHGTVKNGITLLVASILLAPAALTATMFFVCSIVVIVFLGYFLWSEKLSSAVRIRRSALSLAIVFGIHLFWIVSFVGYGITNARSLRESIINSEITYSTIENERKHNTALNSARYYFSWMDIKEDNQSFTFPMRDWYITNPIGNILSFLPLMLAIVGTTVAVKRKQYGILFLAVVGVFGWYLIKGANPPGGALYEWLQRILPLLAQVFRWQSSKLWPFQAVIIPILATVGVLALREWMRRIRFTQWLLPCIILSASLYFVRQFFTGGMTRPDVFVAVPAEYHRLSTYLASHDPRGRIWVAPEANTLYFRTYSWGFWGSVVLNYIVPNPLFEKALVIGSEENEQAYSMIVNAYYSRDPRLFSSNLSQFDVSYVLSDTSVTKKHVGYSYDWDLFAVMVASNPEFIPIWKDGSLTLYSIRQGPSISVDAFTAGHDWPKLIAMRSLLDNKGYAVLSREGSLAPLALKADTTQVTTDALINQSVYQGQAQQMRLIQDVDIGSLPVRLRVSDNRVALSPTVPLVRINGNSFYEIDGGASGDIGTEIRFLTLNETVMPVSAGNASYVLMTPYADATISGRLKVWNSDVTTQDILSGSSRLHCNTADQNVPAQLLPSASVSCETPKLAIANDAVVEVATQWQIDKGGRAIVCLWSDFQRRCLNSNVTVFTSGQTQTFTIASGDRVSQGDSLIVYLTLESRAAVPVRADIQSVSLLSYTHGRTVSVIENNVPTLLSHMIDLATGDRIEVEVPFLWGKGTWEYRPEGPAIPETTYTLFNAGVGQGIVDLVAERELAGMIKEGTLSTYPRLERWEGDALGQLIVDAGNESGVPMEVSLREVKKEYKLFSRRIEPLRRTTSSYMVFMPPDVRSYILEALQTGIGPRPSKNTLYALRFQTIPRAWLDLLLSSEEQSPSPSIYELPNQSLSESTFTGPVPSAGVVSIPAAFSPFWWLIGPGRGEPVRINGWKQGWKVDQPGAYTAFYFGNLLAYAGLIVGIILTLGALVWVSQEAQKKASQRQ